MKTISTYLYITCNKKILFVKKNILAYCGYSPTSPFFLLLSKRKNCDNVATAVIRTARTLEAEWWQVCGEAWVRGQRKMSPVLGTFGLLDFTMLRPVLAWRAFWNLWTAYLFNFPIFFFRAAANRGYGSPPAYLSPLYSLELKIVYFEAGYKRPCRD